VKSHKLTFCFIIYTIVLSFFWTSWLIIELLQAFSFPFYIKTLWNQNSLFWVTKNVSNQPILSLIPFAFDLTIFMVFNKFSGKSTILHFYFLIQIRLINSLHIPVYVNNTIKFTQYYNLKLSIVIFVEFFDHFTHLWLYNVFIN